MVVMRICWRVRAAAIRRLSGGACPVFLHRRSVLLPPTLEYGQ